MKNYIFLKVCEDNGRIHLRTYNNHKIYGKPNVFEEVVFNTAKGEEKINALTMEDIGKIYFIPLNGFHLTNSGVKNFIYQSVNPPTRLIFENIFFFTIRNDSFVPLPNQTLCNQNIEKFDFILPEMIDHMNEGTIFAAWSYNDIHDGSILFDWNKEVYDFTPCEFDFDEFNIRLRNILNTYLAENIPDRISIYRSYVEKGMIKLRLYPTCEPVNIIAESVLFNLRPSRYYYLTKSNSGEYNVATIETVDNNNPIVEKKRKMFYDFIFTGENDTNKRRKSPNEEFVNRFVNETFSRQPETLKLSERKLTPLIPKKKNPNDLCFYRNKYTNEVVQYICMSSNKDNQFDIVYKTTTGEYKSVLMSEFFNNKADILSGISSSTWTLIDRKEESYDNINKTLFPKEFS